MVICQLDFFETTETSEMKAQIEAMRLSCDKCRRKQFKDIGDLRKLVLDLVDRIEYIERGLCNGTH